MGLAVIVTAWVTGFRNESWVREVPFFGTLYSWWDLHFNRRSEAMVLNYLSGGTDVFTSDASFANTVSLLAGSAQLLKFGGDFVARVGGALLR